MSLLEEVLDAAGGIDRWLRLKRFTIHLSMNGALLARKGKAGLMRNIVVEGATDPPSLRLIGCITPDRCGLYQAERVAVEKLDGRVLQDRGSPRAALLQYPDDLAWDDLHLVYFCGLSIWTSLTLPLLLVQAGVALEELPHWSERGETWRPLRARFPQDMATHSPEQIFYFDDAGLLRRTDYEPIGACTRLAEYCSAHQTFSDFTIPTLRRSLRLGADGSVIAKPAHVDIEIFDASFG